MGYKLLIIDDETPVREAVVDIMELIEIEVLEASNGVEGIHLYKLYKEEIGAVLLDMQMPLMNGIDTFRELYQFDPKIRVIISSGYSETETMKNFITDDLVLFLQKPYMVDTLLTKVEQLFSFNAL